MVERFKELVAAVCARPQMYVGGEDVVYGVCNWLNGYLTADRAFPLGRNRLSFHSFVNFHLGFPDKLIWYQSLRMAYAADKEALAALEHFVNEYMNALETTSEEEMLERFSTALAPDRPPERAFRRLLAVLPFAEEGSIRPLLQCDVEPQDLWRQAYPPGVAEQLSEIWSSGRIGRIQLADGGIELMCGELVRPVRMLQLEGSWVASADSLMRARSL